jgi:hypothetical protein
VRLAQASIAIARGAEPPSGGGRHPAVELRDERRP